MSPAAAPATGRQSRVEGHDVGLDAPKRHLVEEEEGVLPARAAVAGAQQGTEEFLAERQGISARKVMFKRLSKHT